MYHAGYIAFRFIRKVEEQQGCLPHLCKVTMFNPNLICGKKTNSRTAVASTKEAWKARKLHWSKHPIFYSNPDFSFSQKHWAAKQFRSAHCSSANSLNSWKFILPKFRVLTLLLTRPMFLRITNFPQGTASAAQAAPLLTSHELMCACEHQVQ